MPESPNELRELRLEGSFDIRVLSSAEAAKRQINGSRRLKDGSSSRLSFRCAAWGVHRGLEGLC